MSMRPYFLAVALGMAVPAAGALPGVSIDKAVQLRLGVRTSPLATTMLRPSLSSFAHVVDPTPLMTLDSDIATAAATAAASAAEDRRARTLAAADATIARKMAEAATAQARGDAAKLLLLRRRLSLEWGNAIAALSARQRGALISELAAGRTALLRIDAPAGGRFPPVRSATIDTGDGRTATAQFFGDSRAADPRQATAGKLALVRGAAARRMAIGLSFPVRLFDGSSQSGVFVPASAVIRQAGKSWVYIQRGLQRFDRMPLSGTAPQPGGLMVRSGLKVGERVVVRGAAQLYTAETADQAGE